MKLFARIFALSLVVTGAAASVNISQSAQHTVSATASALPVPVCPPDGSTDCGFGQGNSN